jgi:hypothetical protein
MENNAKVTRALFLCVLLFCIPSCAEVAVRNPELCVKTAKGNWIVRTRDSVQISEVVVEGKRIPVQDAIDFGTFDYLYKYEEDAAKFNNAFYHLNPPEVYFKDKDFLYFLVTDSADNSYLERKCTVMEYELIGGEYMRIYPKVYWRTSAIENADYRTFGTMNVARNKSEWDATIGYDRNNLFHGDKVLPKELFDSFFWTNRDSLKEYYHY